jgi:hypothetical protein
MVKKASRLKISGDCTLYLLLGGIQPATASRPSLRIVKRAVLIDGGGVDAATHVTLDGVIDELSRSYAFPESEGFRDNRLQFDAIVISRLLADTVHVDHADLYSVRSSLP